MCVTTASDGDYWKERGDVCGECGRPWKWAVWCRLCQACRDSEVHLRRVQGQLRIRPPCVISKAESLSARPGFSTEKDIQEVGFTRHAYSKLAEVYGICAKRAEHELSVLNEARLQDSNWAHHASMSQHVSMALASICSERGRQ